MAHRRPSALDLLEDLARFPEMNPGPVLQVANDGGILLANQAARAFFGQESLVDVSWPGACAALPAEDWQAILAGDNLPPVELDRGGRCVLFTHVRSPNDLTVFVFGADITERRMAEFELQAAAARLAEMARFPDMNPGPVVRTDMSGCVLLANAAAREVFGQDFAGRSWLSILPSLDEAQWATIVAGSERVTLDARIEGRDFLFTHRCDPATQLVFIYGADVSAQRRAEQALRQTEKLATLGTVAAGVAHELNNPAAAARRAAEQLREAMVTREAAQRRLETAGLPASARRLLEALDAESRSRAVAPQTVAALERSDREAAIEAWLEAQGVDDGWSLAPALAEQGVTAEQLEALAAAVGQDASRPLASALAWLAAGFPMYALLHQVGESARRISEIVRALKSYTYLGQAPVQDVDLREGLDNTLVILHSRLKDGIRVVREYDPTLPAVPAHGSELNQVWTNLMDNAVTAMGGRGTLTLRTRRDGDWAVVEVADDGPGIPADIQGRVFDPFFTTKEPGQGTGLGLSTCHSIITEQHRGRIMVSSQPGQTVFVVHLPLTPPRA